MQTPHDLHDQQPHHAMLTSVQVRVPLPREWSDRLDHLAIELGVPKSRLIQEGALLVLRYHGRADELPEPLPPVEAGK